MIIEDLNACLKVFQKYLKYYITILYYYSTSKSSKAQGLNPLLESASSTSKKCLSQFDA